jgi:hypothetical protein
LITITVACDNCGTEFCMEDEMELPPYWMGVQMAVTNGSGLIVGQDLFVHICSSKCLVEFAGGNVIKDKLMCADKEKPRKSEDEEDSEEGGEE